MVMKKGLLYSLQLITIQQTKPLLKMKNRYFILLSFISFVCFFTSCEGDKVISTTEYYTDDEYQVLSASLNIPRTPVNFHLGFNDNTFNSVATLGRVLFYDTNLSKDNSVSCASCHEQHL